MFYKPIDEIIQEWANPSEPNDRKDYSRKKLVEANDKKRKAKRSRKKNRNKK